VKYMAKTLTLPDVQVGGIIEYYYTTDFSEYLVFDSHWILNHELFTKNDNLQFWLPAATNSPRS